MRIRDWSSDVCSSDLRGQTGTGKELLARYLHRESARGGLFVSVNCAAISPTYADVELFGYTVGSHIGSASSRAGWFGSANGGTLYLDEKIGREACRERVWRYV